MTGGAATALIFECQRNVSSEVAIQDEFGIGERTVLRWVDACCREVVDPSGHSMTEAVDRGMLQTARWPVDLTTLPAA